MQIAKLLPKRLPDSWVWILLPILVFQIRVFGLLPLDVADETVYLSPWEPFPPGNDWAPAYYYWYQFWNQVTRDPLLTYRLNAAFLTSVLPVLAFTLLRWLGVGRPWAMLSGLCLFLWEPIAGLPVKITHFSLVLQLAGFWIAGRGFRTFSDRVFFFGACMIWLSLIRQENILLAAGCVSVWAGTLFFGRFFGNERKWAWPGLGALNFALIGLILLRIYNPFTRQRSWFAFLDHFSWSQGKDTLAEFAVGEYFPSAQTIPAALMENPRAVFSYGAGNLKEFLFRFPADLFAVFPGWGWQRWVFLGAAAAGFLLLRKSSLEAPSRLRGPLAFLAVITCLCGIQALGVTFLFQYDLKYLLTFAAFLFLLGACALEPVSLVARCRAWMVALPLTAMLLLAPFTLPEEKRWYLHPVNRQANEIVNQWIRLPDSKGKKVLQFSNYAAYAKSQVFPQTKPPSFILAGIPSAGKFLNLHETSWVILVEKEKKFCRQVMGEADCESLWKVVPLCFTAIRSIEDATLYERKSACPER